MECFFVRLMREEGEGEEGGREKGKREEEKRERYLFCFLFFVFCFFRSKAHLFFNCWSFFGRIVLEILCWSPLFQVSIFLLFFSFSFSFSFCFSFSFSFSFSPLYSLTHSTEDSLMTF